MVVESTYNWYWLIDGLTSAGFEVKLANTVAMKRYDGLKHSGDKDDAIQNPGAGAGLDRCPVDKIFLLEKLETDEPATESQEP